jgi:hypothetical protein
MFDLIEDRAKPELKWWTIPGLAFTVFCLGFWVGILIDRRNSDPLEWAQLVFMIFVSWKVFSPLLWEIQSRIRSKNHNAL